MNRRRPVMSLVVGGSFPLPKICPGCDPLSTVPRSAGGQTPRRDASPGRPRPEREAKAQGKIKGRGTGARRKPCLHVGKGGTHAERRRAAHGARPALALSLARSLYAGIRRALPDDEP